MSLTQVEKIKLRTIISNIDQARSQLEDFATEVEELDEDDATELDEQGAQLQSVIDALATFAEDS